PPPRGRGTHSVRGSPSRPQSVVRHGPLGGFLYSLGVQLAARLLPLRGRLGLLAILAVACSYAYVVQGLASPQLSHYALVRALADGTPRVDRTLHETGDFPTVDLAYYKG